MFLLTYFLKKYEEIRIFFKNYNGNDIQIQNIINEINKKKNDLDFDLKEKEKLKLELLNNKNQIKELRDVLFYQKQLYIYNTNAVKKKYKTLKSKFNGLNENVNKLNETINKNNRQLSSYERKINAYTRLKQHKYARNLRSGLKKSPIIFNNPFFKTDSDQIINQKQERDLNIFNKEKQIKSFNPDNNSFSSQNNYKQNISGSIDTFENISNLNSNFNPPCYKYMHIHEIIYNYVYVFILDIYEFLMILIVFFFG